MESEEKDSFKPRMDVNLIALVAFIALVCILSVYAIWNRKNAVPTPSASSSPTATYSKIVQDQLQLLSSLKIQFPAQTTTSKVELSAVPQNTRGFVTKDAKIIGLFSVTYQSSQTGYQFIYELNQPLSATLTQFQKLTTNLTGWTKIFSGDTEIFSVIEGNYGKYQVQIRLSKKTTDSALVMIRIITK